MLYLASPYSDPDPLIMKTRFLLAEQVTARLLQREIWVYSPIVHCHELALKYELPTDFTFWRAYNFAMLRHADELFVLKIPATLNYCIPINPFENRQSKIVIRP